MSDSAGLLYNKDAIIEHLLPSDDVTEERKDEHDAVLKGRIKSIRDVVEVKFKNDPGSTSNQARRICPITGKELGSSTKSVYLVPCGHAFAELAIKEVPTETCMECNEPFTADDVIPILPLATEDVERLEQRRLRLRDADLTHSLKKAPGSKKRKKNGAADGEIISKKAKTTVSSGAQPAEGSEPERGSGIKNAGTASLTAKVLSEQDEKNKRRKLVMNDNLKSLFSTGTDMSSKSSDFMTRGFSIPKRA